MVQLVREYRGERFPVVVELFEQAVLRTMCGSRPTRRASAGRRSGSGAAHLQPHPLADLVDDRHGQAASRRDIARARRNRNARLSVTVAQATYRPPTNNAVTTWPTATAAGQVGSPA